ncbi:MAG: cysteine desulfurase NifS, partial [Candidatus Limiplasma sp.]|nr:cysteine desulfurase NifS [Candidatus Limiplasma sp.]
SKMLPFFTEKAGNPSSIHTAGREARKAVENARRQVAAALGAEAREIYFTAGGSESDNWAIRCAAAETGKKHVITSAVEHHAVLHSCRALERDSFRITYLPVDENGMVSPADVRRALTDDTALISVMAANNEVGTLEPIQEIGQLAREAGVLFHTDAVQAAGAIPIDVNAWNADLLSLSGHKFHGPKGVGALYIRKGTRIHNLIEGGAQERGLRAGTENVPGVVGMGEALSLAVAELPEYAAHVSALRDRLIQGILSAVPDARLNGHPTLRLPGNAHFSFPGVESESLLMRLDLAGIACSGGSACTSGSLEPSHVLSAMGLSPDLGRSSVRFSLGRDNTAEEIDRVLTVLPPIVADLRSHMRS